VKLQIKTKFSSVCKLDNLFINWKLVLIWLKDFGIFLEMILCKNKAKEYKGLLTDEMIILNEHLYGFLEALDKILSLQTCL